MRELEILKDELRDAGEPGSLNGNAPGGELMQGLYSRKQTELYVPDPVVDVSDYFSAFAFLIDCHLIVCPAL